MIVEPGREPTLMMQNVTKAYRVGRFGRRSSLLAVNMVNLKVEHNSVMGLVGESGSGKTTLGRMAVGLIVPTSGKIVCVGRDIATLKGEPLRKHRLHMQMIFQDSGSSLNPRMTLEELLIEPLFVQGQGTRSQRLDKACKLADEVGLSRSSLSRFPHEFSGGQRQRISIARALILEPEFIVADEPVSALDVSVQAQVLNLLKDIQESRGLSMLFISHDLAVVNFVSGQVTVLYRGSIVEQGEANAIMRSPQNEYTRSLVNAANRGDVGPSDARTDVAGPNP